MFVQRCHASVSLSAADVRWAFLLRKTDFYQPLIQDQASRVREPDRCPTLTCNTEVNEDAEYLGKYFMNMFDSQRLNIQVYNLPAGCTFNECKDVNETTDFINCVYMFIK